MPLRLQKADAASCFHADEYFNALYPFSVATLASRHWTPLTVARLAAEFLATRDKVRILDIGSGVGKFCLSAAYYAPQAMFYGVEQRKRLLHHAVNVQKLLGLENVSFIHGNFTQLDFLDYDHFYFYNAFYENLEGTEKVDDRLDYSSELFHYYNNCLYRQLDRKGPGTRLVTYHSSEEEIPPGYRLMDSMKDGLLRFWIKA